MYWYVFFLFCFCFAGFVVQFSFFRCAKWFANISLMRVCFNGLCFASRRAAAVDEETQTVSDIHDTGGGGHINHICDDSCNIPALSDQRNQNDSRDTTDSSHKILKNHCSASSTARSKLLSLLSLNNIDKKIFFLRTKMDSHDSPRVHQANSNTTYDIDLVNRNHSNNMVSIVAMNKQ